jgi:hypothetical protein
MPRVRCFRNATVPEKDNMVHVKNIHMTKNELTGIVARHLYKNKLIPSSGYIEIRMRADSATIEIFTDPSDM